MRRLIACSALVSALAVTLFGGASALAADGSAPLEDQIYIAPGVLFLGEDDENGINSFISGQIGIGGQFTERFALELIYGSGSSDFDGGGPNSDVDLDYLRLDGIYDLGGETWKPYVAGGVGRYTIEPDVGGRERDTQLNLGLGLMRSITERLSIRGDARYYYLLDERENQPGLTLGLRYVFAGPTAPPDSDGDGVSDATDQCPGTPRGAQVDRFGCELDSDGDGVPDSTDACPRTPAGVSVDSRGCPLDSDGDGVPDHLDQCPRTPRGDRVDERGCTIVEEVEEVEVERIEMRLEFDFNSSDLRTVHFAEIDRVAAFMRENRDTNAQIEGHTDSRGTEAYNQALSERRAYSVRDYLIDEADIDPRRITAVGYGESRPATTNDTDAGRQRNRRVEALIQTGEMSIRQRRDN